MKILRYLIISCVIFLGIILILGLILPKSYDVSTTEMIKAPSPVINRNISDFSQWGRWMPWLTEDQSMKLKMGAQYKGEGASYSWRANKSGSGSMRIDSLIPNKSMLTLIELDGMNSFTGYWKLNPKGDETEVTWGVKTRVSLPLNIAMYFQQSGMQDIFRKGLLELEKVCQKDQKEGIDYGNHKVKFEIFDQKNLIGIKESIEIANMSSFFPQAFNKLNNIIRSNNVETETAPMALFYQWNDENKTTEIATVVAAKEKQLVNGLENFNIPAMKAISIKMDGAYSNSSKAHQVMEEAATDLGLELKAPVIEQYIKGPHNTKNPEEYQTVIYYIYE